MAKKWNLKDKLKKLKFNPKLKERLKNIKRKKQPPEDVPFYLPGEKPPRKKIKESRGIPSFLNLPVLVFDVKNRGKFHRFFLATMILSACWFVGRLTALFMVPKNLKTTPGNLPTIVINVTTPNEWEKYTKLIRNKDLFKTSRPNQPKQKRRSDEKIICDKADSKSNLPLKLMGTVVMQDTIKSLASVQVRGNNKLEDVREGEKVEDMAEIFHIERLRIIFKNLNTNECEFISHQKLDEEDKIESPVMISKKEFKEIKSDLVEDGIKQVGNTICVSRALINEKLANFNEILTQARAIQIPNPDGTLSFKIVEITPGSIYTHLNIQDNDLIKTINGQPITGMQAIMGLFGKISKLPKLNLEIERDGNLIPMSYEFSQTSPATCKE